MEYQQALSAGTILNGAYKIIRILGSGGFANTYLATDINLGREVAIKEYFPSEIAYRQGTESVRVKSTSYDKNFRWGLDRFKREAQILVKFRHSNIVRVFTTFDANETTYMVLEFVKGADLEAWLSKLGRRPTQDEVDALTAPLLEALERVHAEGILHRDVKPANIYIREEDNTPVLLDFGAARSLIVGELTGTTAAIVSRGYSAHEAYATDHKLHGPWSDVYGLAATLYRCLAGESPPESTGRVLNDTLVSATRLPNASEYRARFLKAIDWGLSVLPKGRPQSVSEWRSRLVPGASAQSQPADSVWVPAFEPQDPSRPSTGDAALQSKVPATRAGRGASRAGLVAGSALVIAGIAALVLVQSGTIEQGSLLQSVGLKTDADTQQSDAAQAELQREPTGSALDGGVEAASRQGEAARTPEPQPDSGPSAEDAKEPDQARRVSEDAAAQAKRQAEEAEAQAKRRAEEAEAKRRAQEAEAQAKRRAQEAEAQRRRAQEAEAQARRRAEEAEAKRRAQEAEAQARRRAEEAEAQAKRQAQRGEALAQARQLAEAKAKEQAMRQAEEQARRLAEQDAKRRAEAARAAGTQRRLTTAELAAGAGASTGTSALAATHTPERTDLVRRIQTELRERQCYSGAINGEVDDGEVAIKALSAALQEKGRQVRKVEIRTASRGEIDSWLQWLQDLGDFRC